MNYPFVILCLLILGALGWRICVNARRLQKRIEEFHEEQASNPMDFYIAMNELYQIKEGERDSEAKER